MTLTGSGGVGKTRLAVETARRLAGTFADGAWLVELAALDRPSGQEAARSRLAEMVMAVLDVQDTAGSGEQLTSTERLTGALRPRELLLVLDNCEHVVDQVAELAELLLRAVPGLRILATSQEQLALAGEVVWSVPPLEVPGRAADTDLTLLEQSSAVRLFVARAAAAAQAFTLDADTAPAVAVLCRRLDGIPLALELAATRVRALGVHGLVTRLDDRFRLLATGHRGAPPRQQTLMAMIDWSWELLTGTERVVLRRLAVHADGCTLEAAEAVCAGDDVGVPEVLDTLARLVDRSLVVVVHDAQGPRYRLLESVAAYCVERMQEAGEFERVRRRHHHYYTGIVEKAEPHLYGSGQRQWLRRLDAEAANIRGALDSMVRDGDRDRALRLVNAMAWYWFLRGRLTEARRSLEAALAVTGEASAAVRARAMAWQVGIALLQGDATDRPSPPPGGAAVVRGGRRPGRAGQGRVVPVLRRNRPR
ncbi:ATP-binding protein [Streptosporangium lutulentum]